jgi:hypothetical protein
VNRFYKKSARKFEDVVLEATPLATFLALLNALDDDDGDEHDGVVLISAIEAFMAKLPPEEMRPLSFRLRLVMMCCKVVASRQERKGDFFCCTEPFGGCPQCGKQDGYLNSERDHWGYCDAHKCCWSFGHDLSSTRENETKEEQKEKLHHIEGYAKVEPLQPGAWSTDPIMRAYERGQRRIADAERQTSDTAENKPPKGAARTIDGTTVH